jgi:hypothetical protein
MGQRAYQVSFKRRTIAEYTTLLVQEKAQKQAAELCHNCVHLVVVKRLGAAIAEVCVSSQGGCRCRGCKKDKSDCHFVTQVKSLSKSNKSRDLLLIYFS